MMKRSFLNLVCIGCVACAFTACSDDDNNVVAPIDGEQRERVPDTYVSFAISQSSPGTYAYQTTYGATPEESEITGPVLVYVFDDDGVFETYESLAINTSAQSGVDYETDPFQLSSGNKFFYVFANIPQATIGSVAKGTDRKTFETKQLNTAIGTMTPDYGFYIATLEPKIINVPKGGTKDDPEPVRVKVGRMAAKVTLVDNGSDPDVYMKGNFDFAGSEYRLINEATAFYTIGQSSLGIGITGNIMTSPHFTDAYASSNITGPSSNWTGASSRGEIYYTKENTHATPLNGTATSVQYRIKYTPVSEEIYNLDGDNNASLSNGDFWAARVGRADDYKTIIFNENPAGKTIPGLGEVLDNTTTKYTGGYSYYVIPIADNAEALAAARYSVIRNHYYQMTITSIARLGTGTPDEITEPEEEIDDETWIVVEIEVLPWYLIEQEVDL